MQGSYTHQLPAAAAAAQATPLKLLMLVVPAVNAAVSGSHSGATLNKKVHPSGRASADGTGGGGPTAAAAGNGGGGDGSIAVVSASMTDGGEI